MWHRPPEKVATSRGAVRDFLCSVFLPLKPFSTTQHTFVNWISDWPLGHRPGRHSGTSSRHGREAKGKPMRGSWTGKSNKSQSSMSPEKLWTRHTEIPTDTAEQWVQHVHSMMCGWYISYLKWNQGKALQETTATTDICICTEIYLNWTVELGSSSNSKSSSA